MAKFTDVSDWEERPWYNSGGTRNKKVISDPNGINYYFKESFKKGSRHFKHEFFSEVIASYLGSMIGLNVLEYGLAAYNDKLGCLSKAMNEPEEDLIEGDKYLKAYDPTFIKEHEKPGAKYTFQLIERTLDDFTLSSNLTHIIDIIIFDSIIGNSDRHQENWGFISKSSITSRVMKEMAVIAENDATKVPRFFVKLIKWARNSLIQNKSEAKDSLVNDITITQLVFSKVRFAPIYDSGCCLGRELADEKVKSMLTDQIQLESYINRGESEIHWDGNKIKHFDLLLKLIERDSTVKERIRVLINKFSEADFIRFIDCINDEIPDSFENHKLPEYRKQLIIKLITSRIKRIREIINE